ncbi:class I SAM-dependent methyltransferase [Bacillus shivajii]|uniref:class I SAM-dependent methyltransferase n=1 Tax=Bacillus shivajii TaxID=1983719 RepID=UPI001CFC2B35|nr:class I SAM-dependent methyltransferase [Bacillus shivajii]UCZ53490.1 class I SAM-dependent methyltransferase [Bacillus shivajii]
MKNKSLLDNFEEYDDPALYDRENERYKGDIPFLQKWAEKMDGPIIDVACGTGRATIPLGQEGYELIGVDVHQGMLDEAKKKADNLNLNVKWLKQDCTNLDLHVKSSLIYTVGNSFQHFLTNEDQDGLLKSVNRHLKNGGIFIFGTRFPVEEDLIHQSSEEYWRTYPDPETSHEVDVYTISRYDALDQVQHCTTIRKYKDNQGCVIDEKRTNINLRYVFPKEMERLLDAHGFEILHVYEDWNETPITNDSNEMVYVCKKHGDGSTASKAPQKEAREPSLCF